MGDSESDRFVQIGLFMDRRLPAAPLSDIDQVLYHRAQTRGLRDRPIDGRALPHEGRRAPGRPVSGGRRKSPMTGSSASLSVGITGNAMIVLLLAPAT